MIVFLPLLQDARVERIGLMTLQRGMGPIYEIGRIGLMSLLQCETISEIGRIAYMHMLQGTGPKYRIGRIGFMPLL